MSAVATRTCTAYNWCVSEHTEDTTLHESASVEIPTKTGPVLVTAYRDERKGISSAYIGDIELTPSAAHAAASALIAAAELG